jgi:hypothetical protein
MRATPNSVAVYRIVASRIVCRMAFRAIAQRRQRRLRPVNGISLVAGPTPSIVLLWRASLSLHNRCPGGATMKARIFAGMPGCAFSDVEWSVPVGS